jgi:hypothetical protein
MSDFTAIRAVSLTLRELLRVNITNSTDPQLSGVAIELRSPRQMRDAQLTGVSLWLYRVTRDRDMLNYPPERIVPNQLRHHPLPVNLYYLVTPINQNLQDEQALLGKVLQVFNDHAILRGGDLQDTLQSSPEEFRLTLETLTLEELTRVWDALKEPYQLSVCYLVQVITIDSAREPLQTAPVVVREAAYKQILSTV